MDEIQEALLKRQEAEQPPPITTPFINETVREVRESAKIKPQDIATSEAEVLAKGSDSDFWRVLKKRLQTRVDNMRAAQSSRLAAGRIDLQEVGLRSLIVNEIADSFQDVINMVESTYKKQDIPEEEQDDLSGLQNE